MSFDFPFVIIFRVALYVFSRRHNALIVKNDIAERRPVRTFTLPGKISLFHKDLFSLIKRI